MVLAACAPRGWQLGLQGYVCKLLGGKLFANFLGFPGFDVDSL
jgi:hypothetical protein